MGSSHRTEASPDHRGPIAVPPAAVGPRPLGVVPPWRTFAQMLATILGIEFLIMMALEHLPPITDPILEALADGGTLTILSAPVLWWIVSRPLREATNAERFRLEAQIGAVLQASADATIVTDERGRILLFNRGAEETFGYRAEEVVGKEIGILMPAGAVEAHRKHLARFATSVEAARPMDGRDRLVGVRKGGDRFPAEISIARSAGATGATLVATVRDVTRRVRAEEELQRARDLAEAGTRAKSEFLANMSHEIRTPMNAVIGLTGLLLDTPLDAEQRDFVQTVRTSGDQLLAIINDILDYSKIESGKLELESQRFDVRECVESALDLVGHRAAEKRLDLLYLVEDDVPTAVNGDVTRLRQILVNLVGNAVKFTSAGEVFVHVDASVPSRGRIELEIDVRDTGIGIPADRIDRLFQSFSQVDASTTRQYGGTGLGLAISKRLAELMGGRMWVTSEEGRGSTFSFVIVAEEAHAEVKAVRGNVRHLKGRRILVVDDNATNRLILERQIAGWGADVRLAPSARVALGLIGTGEKFDAIIMDGHMPEMDGSTTAAEIRRLLGPAAPPMIHLTSGSEISRDGNFAVSLLKPAKAGQILRALDTVLGTSSGAEKPSEVALLDAEMAAKYPLRVLLAEDNSVNQKVAERIFARLGYRIDVVSNGLEALEAVERQPYDVVFMDVQMPVMDGLEATRQILALDPAVARRPRIVAMTAGALDADRTAARDAGMVDFVSKPVRVEELQAAIRRAAEGRDVETDRDGPGGAHAGGALNGALH